MTLSLMSILVGAVVGAAFGAAYLGLLWVAVQSLPQDRSGLLVFLGLGLVRIILLLGALAAATAFGLPVEGIAAAVAGFIGVRITATRLLGQAPTGDSTWK